MAQADSKNKNRSAQKARRKPRNKPKKIGSKLARYHERVGVSLCTKKNSWGKKKMR